MGPKTDPCGTPHSINEGVDVELAQRTNCVTVCGDRDTTRTTGVRYNPIRRRCAVGEVGSTDRQS